MLSVRGHLSLTACTFIVSVLPKPGASDTRHLDRFANVGPMCQNGSTGAQTRGMYICRRCVPVGGTIARRLRGLGRDSENREFR